MNDQPKVGDIPLHVVAGVYAVAGAETQADLKRRGWFPEIYLCPKCYRIHGNSKIGNKHRYLVLEVL